MPGIINEVDGRVYVDGGPECDNVYWIYYLENKCPTCSTSLHEPHPGHDKNCPACHGTGVKAVQDWPDADLDEFLNRHFDTWDLQMRRELHTYKPVYYVQGEPWLGFNAPCDDMSRGAKVCAVIAVARQQTQEVAK